MRRTALLMAVLGVFATGLGCKHYGGKCDCQAHESDAVLPGPSTPYPAMPATTTTLKTPDRMPAAVVPMGAPGR